MHSYGYTLLAGDILRLPLTRSFSTYKRSLKKPQGHVTLRPSSQEIGAYAADRNAGVSQHLLGISHSLQDILKPSINVVQVRRQPPAGIVGLADLLRDVPSFKAQSTCTSQPKSVQQAVQQLLSYLPDHQLSQMLCADMQSIIHEFANLSGFEAIDAALSVIISTSCPRFHADHVQLRCLCTYIGEGTYFVPNKAVNRHNWMRALGIRDTNGFGVKSATSVQQASEWDVVLLKGEAFPGNQGAGAVHKSPHASAECPRLLLTLDEARQRCCDNH